MLYRLLAGWLGVVSLVGAATVGAADEQSPPRPHIVYLLADDLGRDDVGWRGSKIETPNLDRLAKAGAELNQYYVQSVCSPTRAALLTGRYPFRYGFQVGVVRPWANYGLNTDEYLLSQTLQDAGYETAIVGKWHLGHVSPEYLPTRRGFDHQYGHYNGALDYNTHDRDGGHDWHQQDQPVHDQGYSTDLLAQAAVRIIEQRDPEKPLFLYVPFNAVHSPFQAPQELIDRYPNLSGNQQKYAAMLHSLDLAVGQIVSSLEAQGQLANTLFIFSSDNGGPNPGKLTNNGPLRAGKGTLYEGGVRVVSFATWQGKIEPGSVIDQPIHAVDWYPTLAKLAGATTEKSLPLDGVDIWPVLTTGQPRSEAEIVLNISPNNGAIRIGDWKLIVREPADGRGDTGNAGGRAAQRQQREYELYRLSDDLSERNNLAASHPADLQRLLQRYDELAAEAVAPLNRGGGQPPAGWKAPAVYGH